MTDLKDKLKEGEEVKKPEAPAEKKPDVINPNPEANPDPEKQDLKKRISDLEFSNAFAPLASEYVHANEFSAQIREKVNGGYTIKDATVAVLAENGKLITATQAREAANRGRDLGGSADMRSPAVSDSSKEKTLDELAKEFQEAEARGEIRLG